MLEVDILTAQTDQQHTPRVRVADDGGEQPLRQFLVLAHLGAAGIMRQGKDPVALTGDERGSLFGNVAHQGIDAGDRGDNPDLIARRRPAVRPQITPEGIRQRMLRRGGRGYRAILIIQKTFQICPDVMAVQPAPGGDVLCDMADGAAVLPDVLPGAEIPQGHFVAHGDVVERDEALSCHLDFCVFCDITKSDCHVVARVNADQVLSHPAHHSATEPSRWRQTGFFHAWGVSFSSRTSSLFTSTPSPGSFGICTLPSVKV